MPIYLSLANLVVAKRTVARKYRGGVRQFREDYGIGSDNLHQEDNEMFSLSAMNCNAFDIPKLTDRGLHFDEKNSCSDDFVINARYGGCLWGVDWLVENGVYAWHQDCAREELKRVREVLSLSVAEVLALQKRGESPLGTIRK
jgi:hypothetical protein